MGFRIHTNIAAMNIHRNEIDTNQGLDDSLKRLSSGLRISSATDDASGMAIANQLHFQAMGLTQSIHNANDGIGVTQTADGALDKYADIINSVRTKSIQAASDGQNSNTRKFIQADITKLLQEANNIAKTTSFNGQQLLDGNFQNKSFHIGAYSNEVVGINIANTQTNTIGRHVDITGAAVDTAAIIAPVAGSSSTSSTTNNTSSNSNNSTFTAVSTAANNNYYGGGGNSGGGSNTTTTTTTTGPVVAGTLTIDTDALSAAVTVGATSADTGGDNDTVSIAHSADSAWAKALAINAVATETEVNAIASTEVDGSAVVSGTINAGDFTINDIDIGKVDVKSSDANASLMNAINTQTSRTGTVATNSGGKLVLSSTDGSDIKVSGANSVSAITGLAAKVNTGKITLFSDHTVQLNSGATKIGFKSSAHLSKEVMSTLSQIDVRTKKGAEKAIRTTDSALKQLDAIRSSIGASQNQLQSTVENISKTHINIASTESRIRNVDFANESANFSKYKILAQSGAYAMSQANIVQQHVLRLLA